jgi:hypothetical protein
MAEAIEDACRFRVQVVARFQYGTESSDEDFVMASTTMNGYHPL